MRRSFRTGGALLLAAAMAACAGARGATTTPGQAAAARAPNPADVRFISDMIGHHAQALVMSRMAPANASRSSIKTLAARIINAQQDEIRIMQVWLRDHGQPAPAVDSTGAVSMPGMAGHEHGQHHAMPGMLTAEQLAQLEKAKGEEFDKLFLQFMIQHHRGATEMVRQLFASQGAALDDTVFKLASDVNADQLTEIERMRRMLTEITIGIRVP
jgi:uncharacterized protein (DUF305 family)